MKRFAFFVSTIFVSTISVFSDGSSVRAAELVYFNSPACSVCERWDEEVGVLYNSTEEAQRLPLRPQSIHDEKPDDLAQIKPVAFTPTFVVVDDGREIGRIVGYISDYFFWEQIAGLIKKADAMKAVNGTACSDPATSARPAIC